MTHALLEEPRAAEILRDAQLLYVTIDSKRGPHVTPELFVTWGGKLWFATARRTLKRRVVDRAPEVGATAWVGDRYLVISGEAEVYDPLDIHGILRPPLEQLSAVVAAAHFAARNARHLAGLALGQPRDLIPTPSTIRTLVGVEPERAILGKGNEIEWESGDWAPAHPRRKKGAAGEHFDLPPLSRAHDAAMVGWDTPRGPVALPSRWNAIEKSAAVPSALLETTGADRDARGSVVIDSMEGYGISSKRGAVVRGEAYVEWAEPTARICMDPEKETRWVGVETQTIDVG